MDTSKLYESCDISRRTTAITAGEETFAETVVFSGLPCYIRPVKANIVESSNEQSNNQGVYVTIDNGHAVQVWDIITSAGIRYQVANVKAYGLIQNSNTRLKCDRI